MKLNSARIFMIWDGEVLATWRETFLNVKRIRTELKGMVSHDEGELNANYPKMLRFTHKFREKIAMKFIWFHIVLCVPLLPSFLTLLGLSDIVSNVPIS